MTFKKWLTKTLKQNTTNMNELNQTHTGQNMHPNITKQILCAASPKQQQRIQTEIKNTKNKTQIANKLAQHADRIYEATRHQT